MLCTPVLMGFPGGSNCKEFTCNAGDLGSIPGLGRSPEGRHGNPFQNSCLENPHGRRSLAGCSPRVCKELDMTERLSSQYQYSCLENPMHRGAWRVTIHRVAKSLSD